mmetsp:Transcript_21327/g.3459  ORF Transcript_21327/g.3459 Transcript_21327/m.3459 type:complete len:85 (-) Transcript_21327:1660-1914(-)
MGFLISVNIWLFRRFKQNKRLTLDLIEVTPADFTLWAKHLPKDFDEKKLKDFIENKSRSTFTEVVSLNWAYNIGEYIELSRKIV